MTAPDIPEETLNGVFLTRSKIGKYYSIPDDKRDLMFQYFQKVFHKTQLLFPQFLRIIYCEIFLPFF